MGKILVVSLSPTIQKTLFFKNGWNRGAVNRTPAALMSASGKGANTARILAQGGEQTALLTQSGGFLAPFFSREMKKTGVDMATFESGGEIRFCYTVITDNPYEATELVEEGDPVSPEAESELRRLFSIKIQECSMLIIAGSASPGFSSHVYLDLIREASALKIPVVIDRHGPILVKALETGPLVVKINMYEFLLSHMPGKTQSQDIGEEWYSIVERKGRELYDRYGHRFVLTNGSRDTLIIDSTATRLSPEKLRSVNPIGCGDAVTAGTAAGLNRGLSLRDGVRLGMSWAALNLQRLEPGSIN